MVESWKEEAEDEVCLKNMIWLRKPSQRQKCHCLENESLMVISMFFVEKDGRGWRVRVSVFVSKYLFLTLENHCAVSQTRKVFLEEKKRKISLSFQFLGTTLYVNSSLLTRRTSSKNNKQNKL